MSWSRTLLSLSIAGVLTLKVGVDAKSISLAAIGTCIALSFGLFSLSLIHRQKLLRSEKVSMSRVSAATASISVVVLASLIVVSLCLPVFST